jgi:hypothetical protein
MPAAIDIKGKKFGRLTATSYFTDSRGIRMWNCDCECGGTNCVKTASLSRGQIRSCGCLMRETSATISYAHGFARRGTRHPDYGIWRAMIDRCYYPSNVAYEHYGARGIRVCDEWRHDFARFIADMGERPSPQHSIDRYPDNNGNYTPGNCRWATKAEQAENKRPRKILIKDEDFIGRRFGALTVAQSIPRESAKQGHPRKFVCRCDCGAEIIAPMGDLTRTREPRVKCSRYCSAES